MSLFFMLSGVFFAGTMAARLPGAFILEHLRLIWPLVLWTCIVLLFKAIAGARPGSGSC